MRLASLALLMAVPLLAGCATDGEPANPNLLAPKVVVDALPDGSLTIFVHSAFGERRYDRLEILVDNASESVRTASFSIEHRVNRTPAFLEVRAASGEETFRFQGLVALPPVRDERIEVAFVSEEGEWSEAREYGLPFERILERPELKEAA